ncbi:DUF6603 domain-containing protein [Streptomyces sp. NPDC093707]|uniref:DUF6603 domain-containing protein n=1 Tax=Streptomyces sp. NPDC093707 TaxID=3154984 RepID=UPI00344F2E07
MTLNIAELRQRIADSEGGTFQITGAELGAAELIERHLGGTLSVGQVKSPADLTVTGTASLPETPNVSVTVTFSADADGTGIAGFDIVFALIGWAFHTHSASLDFGYLAGFGFTQPRFALRRDVGAVLLCTLDGIPYRVPVDGDGSPVADTDDEQPLDKVTQAFGCGFPAELGISLTNIWFRYDPEAKALVVSGNVKLGGGTPPSTVKWALVVRPRRGESEGHRCAGLVQADLGLSLSGLPVLQGLVPPAHDLVMNHVALVFTTTELDATDVKDINALLSDAKTDFPKRLAPQFPTGPLDSGVTASLAYDLGGAPREAVKVRLGEASRTWADLPQPDPGPSGAADRPAKPESSGPFRMGNITLGYAAGAVQILMDFSVTVSGMTFEASGLGVNVPVANPSAADPVAGGLGVNAKVTPLSLGAALRNRPDATWPVRYEGAGMVTAPVISVAIAGAYARKADGETSLFLFGRLGAGTGEEAGFGPPAFRVKDVTLGGGYHSEVRVPELAEVDSFPLLAPIAKDATALAVLETLTGGVKPWVAPQPGANWIAAGVHWTTFEFVDFRAVALAEFGESLVLSLLGLGRFDFPRDRPAKADPTVRVEIAAEALYRQSEGLLSLSAQLTPGSFIYDENCKPTGALALCTWVDPSPHAGDFVVSVGGYHPGFTKPGHYPALSRAGITWAISNTLSLSAQGYAAVTPHAAMLGGSLALVFDSGAVRAWFTAHLDALIQWAPFWFDVSMGVTIGVQATIDVGVIHTTISVEVGVDVDLWGPRFGGIATVHLWFISFDIGFGAERPDHLPAASWTQFQSHLPPKQQAVQSNPVEGLSWKPIDPDAPELDDARDEAPATTWRTSTHGFTFVTSTAVPATKALLGDRTVHDGDDHLHIRPMGQGGLTSTHTVTVTQDGRAIDHSAWAVEPVYSNVPEALWGTGTSSLDGTGLLTGRLTGLRIGVPAPVFGGGFTTAPGALAIDALVPQGADPLDPNGAPQGPVPQTDPDTIAVLTAPDTGIAAPATADRRTALHAQLATLGYALDADDTPTGYAAAARNGLAAEPLLVPTGK